MSIEELLDSNIEFKRALDSKNYDLAYTFVDFPRELTAYLIKRRINPLNYMTSIPKEMYKELNITSIVIPGNIKSIGNHAFEGCKALTSVIIEEGVEEIGFAVFTKCRNIEVLELPESAKLSNLSLLNMSNLKKLVLPDSLNVLPSARFRSLDLNYYKNCVYFGTRTNPYAIFVGVSEDNNKYSNRYGSKMARTIVMHDDTRFIAEYALSGFSLLERLVIPNNVIIIGAGAFEGCSKLRSIELPDSIKELAGRAFSGCKSLEDLTIPPLVTEIEPSLCEGCEALKNVILPEGLDRISNKAFYGTGLESVKLPDTLADLGLDAFACCNRLLGYSYPEGEYLGNEKNQKLVLYKYYGIEKSFEIDASTLFIHSEAFKDSLIEKITIPKHIISLGDRLFLDCKYLEEVVFENRLVITKNSIFKGCINLKNVSYSAGSISISDNTFMGCKSLLNVLPDRIRSIRYNAFAYSEFKNDIELSAKRIYAAAFLNSKLKGVKLDASSCEAGAFQDATIELLSPTQNGFDVYKDLSKERIFGNIKSYSIYHKNAIISKYLYSYSNIKSAYTPNLNMVDDYGFCNCWYLKEIIISNKTEFGKYAFSGCDAIETIYFEGDKPNMSLLSKVFSDSYDYKVLLYSEEEKKNCWHYDSNGMPSIW